MAGYQHVGRRNPRGVCTYTYVRVHLYIIVCVADGVAKLRAFRAAGRQPELTTKWMSVKQAEVSRLRGDFLDRWKLRKQLIRLILLFRFDTRHERVSFPGAHAVMVTIVHDNAHSTTTHRSLFSLGCRNAAADARLEEFGALAAA